jgi:hypothetical protein
MSCIDLGSALVIDAGTCELQDGCIASPGWPNSYLNNQDCTIRVLFDAVLDVPSFSISTAENADTCEWVQDGECDELEVCELGTDCTDCDSCGDVLSIGSVSYSGSSGPDGVVLSAGDVIQWDADGSETSTGWLMCAEACLAPRGHGSAAMPQAV